MWRGTEQGKYFSSLYDEATQPLHQKARMVIHGHMETAARSGMSSGVQAGYTISAYCGHMITAPLDQLLAAYDGTVDALGLSRTTTDLDALDARGDSIIEARVESCKSELYRELKDLAPPGTGNFVQQVADQSLREFKRKIERRRIEARRQYQGKSLTDRLTNLIGEINERHRARYGFAIFIFSDPRPFAEVAKIPGSQEELSARILALALVLQGVDQRELKSRLKDPPEGAINQWQRFWGASGDAFPESAFATLRCVARLRNGYPVHPADKRVQQAARALGVSNGGMAPQEAWTRVTAATLSALEQIKKSLGS